MIYIWYTGLGGKSNQSNNDNFLWHCTNWQAENMKIYQVVLREEQYVYIWCYNLSFSSLIISNPFKLATTFCLKLVYIYTLSYNNPYLYLTLFRTYYVFKDDDEDDRIFDRRYTAPCLVVMCFLNSYWTRMRYCLYIQSQHG